MGRLFERSAGEQGGPGWWPTAETEEADDAYLVRAELPGVQRDDINIEVTGNELRISGEIAEEEDRRGNTLRRRTGRFDHRTTLPADADADNITADLADGVLTVRIPKSEQGRPRRIQITG